jgi:hypothetical protein
MLHPCVNITGPCHHHTSSYQALMLHPCMNRKLKRQGKNSTKPPIPRSALPGRDKGSPSLASGWPPKPMPRPRAPGPRPVSPATVPQRPVAPKLLPRLNPTRNAGDGPCRPPPTTPPTSNPPPVTPWRFQGAQAAPGTWEKESATYWEGIGSSSPERAVSPSISSPMSSVGEDIGAASGLWERIRGRRNRTRKHSGG